MSTLPSVDYYQHGNHVDFPGEHELLYGYRVSNPSDGVQVKAQYYGESLARSPEMTLLLAILERAVLDLELTGNTPTMIDAKKSAARWVMSDEDGPFAFVWVCDGLGFNAEYVRAGLCKKFGVK